jgi:FkbM family methyltransferase
MLEKDTSDFIFSLTQNEAIAHIMRDWLEVASGKPILLGAGIKGRETLAALRQSGLHPCCFADDTASKHGTSIDGLPVRSVEEALNGLTDRPIVIVCIFTPGHQFKNIAKRVRALRSDALVIPFFTALLATQDRNFENYFLSHPEHEVKRLPIYRELYDKLTDSSSRIVLLEHLRLRLMHDTSIGMTPRSITPFPATLFRNRELSYVDGGAFDGDTVEEFIQLHEGCFREIHAVEPDSLNLERLQNRFNHLPNEIRQKILIHPMGLWRESCHLGFAADGTMGSRIELKSSKKIAVTSLDSILTSVSSPVLIKLDLEGAEMEALAGAVNVTKRIRPAWAVSAYHRPSDLISIFGWLEASGQDYSYALRCHGGDGADLMFYAY